MDTQDQLPFAALLRQHRRRAGLTQEELAEQAGLSTRGISDLERGLKQRPHRDTVDLLADALRLSNEERASFVASVVRLRSGSRGDDVAAVHHLPGEPTPLIGREREEAEALSLLRWDTVRLLTFTGTGGVGKSHLALHVASHLAEDLKDGAAFVPLATIVDPDLVPSTVASSLGLRESSNQPAAAMVIDYLRDRRMALLLDNFEQVVDAAPFVADLLSQCPRLSVLVTSREPLRLRAEQELPVSPLDVPDTRLFAYDHRPPLERLLQYPAFELFLQRTRAVNPRFEPTPEDATAIARITIRLDGLPLALEMAAARIRTHTPEVVLEQLESRLNTLVGGARDLPSRQRTMRSAIAWSYDLLDDVEQRAFRELCAFTGGFDLEAAAAVISPLPPERGDLDDLVASLVEKHLVRVVGDTDQGMRFGTLETIREYGLEQLTDLSELPEVQRRHAAYFLHLVEHAESEIRSSREAVWKARIEREHDNIRTALRWATSDGDSELGLQLAGRLYLFWGGLGHISEGRAWVAVLLNSAHSARVDDRARALHAAACLAYWQGDLDEAERQWERALALYRELDDTWNMAGTLNGLGVVAGDRSDHDRATALLSEAAELHRALGTLPGLGGALNNLGNIARTQAEYQRAAQLYEEALDLYRQVGNALPVAVTLQNLADLESDRGNYDRAVQVAEESLKIAHGLKDRGQEANVLKSLGTIAEDRGERARAEHIYNEALSLYRALGNAVSAAWVLLGLARLAVAAGEVDGATRHADEALVIMREATMPEGVARGFMVLGDIACERGDLDGAMARYEEGAEIMSRINMPLGIARSLEHLAHVTLLRGDVESADGHYAEATTLREHIGAPRSPVELQRYEEDQQTLLRTVSPEQTA